MVAPSSSCMVMDDLSLQASCDDATSQHFFSKGGGGDLSWPAAAEIESKLTKQESLVALCDKYGVPRELTPVCADTLRCRVCETPPPPQGSNALCIYSDALEAGLRFPLHDFYLKLLRHYRLAPSQLVPNALKYMAAFVLRCEDAGVQPQVSAFGYFFSVCVHKRRKDEPTGWHHFTPYTGCPRLFSGTRLTSKHDWKTRFFFLKSPEGMSWKCPVAWGMPRMEMEDDARTVELTDAAVVDKLKQMPCIDLKEYLSLHAPPVGALTLTMLQLHLHSTPAIARGSQLDTMLAKRTAGEGDHLTPQKRRCPGPGPGPGPGPAAVTPQSLTSISLSLQGMEITPGTSLPPGIQTGNSDFMHCMVRMQDEQQGNQIAQLQFKLRESEAKLQESKAMNYKFLEYLCQEKVDNDLLKKKLARLIKEQAAGVARVKAECAAEILEEQASAVARLNEDAAENKCKMS